MTLYVTHVHYIRFISAMRCFCLKEKEKNQRVFIFCAFSKASIAKKQVKQCT